MKTIVKIPVVLCFVAAAAYTQVPIRSLQHQLPLEGGALSGNSQMTPSHTFSGAVDTAWVRHYGSGLLNNPAEHAEAIAVDGDGNVYVAGTVTVAISNEPVKRSDYATIKYNSLGDTLWVSRYNGPADTTDEASSLTVDSNGNVYITGSSYGSGTGRDYATIKYNSAGETVWVRRYNGPGNGSDNAEAIAVDAIGNVYVTGSSYSSETYGDYATIKYNSAGDTVWVRRYDRVGNSEDGATSIAVDGNGNVYVTGYSYDASTNNYDCATIKYDSVGDTLWVSRYNGPGNNNDQANSLAVDAGGNVYVTGRIDAAFGNKGAIIGGDYGTIKYNSAGDTVWVRRYDGPGNGGDNAVSVVVDGSGNVYVTGNSIGADTSSDYATIKYNSAGNILWVRRYNGSANSHDAARSLAIDGSGNVIVTGSSGFDVSIHSGYDYATIKYDSAGDTVWVRRYEGPGNSASALTVDGNGNVYVTGSSVGSYTDYDYATIKYNSVGDRLWVSRYNNPGQSYDVATSLAADESGNVYVTGYSYNSPANSDYATIKYNSRGDPVWVRRYNGIWNTLALDRNGNVYVTGSSAGDYATIKYTSAGDTVWARRYNGPGNGFDAAYSLAVDASGNVYVTGESSGDYATIKYNSAGDTLWTRQYDGPGNTIDYALSLDIDASGNVYVTGRAGVTYRGFWGTWGGDYATIKYNSTGDSIWVRLYNGPGDSSDQASSIAFDGSGNVYVTGYSYGSGMNSDYTTIKYNAAGDTVSVRRYNGPGDGADWAISPLEVDETGNVFVTGGSYSSETGFDYATIKYDSAGNIMWVERFNGPGHADDYASSLAVDEGGNVYVTGSNGSGIITIKYSATGNEEWTAFHSYGAGSTNGPCGIRVDATGNVYVAGSSAFNGQSVYTVIKYVQTPTSVYELTSAMPTEFALAQNYPNPFNPGTVIRYQVPISSKVSLRVYDVLGREVAKLVNEEQRAGVYEAEWDAAVSSGVYFYRLEAVGNDGKSFVETKKMILVK